MASRQSQRRLSKEYKSIQTTPPPFITAKPNDENILEWHYIITGPTNTPFESGQYHGMLRFPQEYPFKPPSISIITPNGRFATNQRLCLSMSDYHPDTWNPAWSVATILTGLLSFMTGDESTTGSITTSDNVKRKLARESLQWNIKENPRFTKQFPDVVVSNKQELAKRAQAEAEEKLKALNSSNCHGGAGGAGGGRGGGANLGMYQDGILAEQPIDFSQLDKLDPEDRARILVEHEKRMAMLETAAASANHNGLVRNLLSGGGILGLAGVAIAAVIAAYFSILRRG